MEAPIGVPVMVETVYRTDVCVHLEDGRAAYRGERTDNFACTCQRVPSWWSGLGHQRHGHVLVWVPKIDVVDEKDATMP